MAQPYTSVIAGFPGGFDPPAAPVCRPSPREGQQSRAPRAVANCPFGARLDFGPPRGRGPPIRGEAPHPVAAPRASASAHFPHREAPGERPPGRANRATVAAG